MKYGLVGKEVLGRIVSVQLIASLTRESGLVERCWMDGFRDGRGEGMQASRDGTGIRNPKWELDDDEGMNQTRRTRPYKNPTQRIAFQHRCCYDSKIYQRRTQSTTKHTKIPTRPHILELAGEDESVSFTAMRCTMMERARDSRAGTLNQTLQQHTLHGIAEYHRAEHSIA